MLHRSILASLGVALVYSPAFGATPDKTTLAQSLAAKASHQTRLATVDLLNTLHALCGDNVANIPGSIRAKAAEGHWNAGGRAIRSALKLDTVLGTGPAWAVRFKDQPLIVSLTDVKGPYGTCSVSGEVKDASTAAQNINRMFGHKPIFVRKTAQYTLSGWNMWDRATHSPIALSLLTFTHGDQALVSLRSGNILADTKTR